MPPESLGSCWNCRSHKAVAKQQNGKWQVRDFLSCNRGKIKATLSELKDNGLGILTDTQESSKMKGDILAATIATFFQSLKIRIIY